MVGLSILDHVRVEADVEGEGQYGLPREAGGGVAGEMVAGGCEARGGVAGWRGRGRRGWREASGGGGGGGETSTSVAPLLNTPNPYLNPPFNKNQKQKLKLYKNKIK